jgi:hypothetical protein
MNQVYNVKYGANDLNGSSYIIIINNNVRRFDRTVIWK